MYSCNTKIFALFLSLANIGCVSSQPNNLKTITSPILSPFSNLDTIAMNDWWNRGPNLILNMKIPRDQVIAFGSGYELIRLDKLVNLVTFECWPREANVRKQDARQIIGWPIAVELEVK